MTDHNIEYRGFTVPGTYLGDPDFLDAWRVGIDQALEVSTPKPPVVRSAYDGVRYAGDTDGWYFRWKDGVITYLTARGLGEGEAPSTVSEVYASFGGFLADWPYDPRELDPSEVPRAYLDGLNP